MKNIISPQMFVLGLVLAVLAFALNPSADGEKDDPKSDTNIEKALAKMIEKENSIPSYKKNNEVPNWVDVGEEARGPNWDEHPRLKQIKRGYAWSKVDR